MGKRVFSTLLLWSVVLGVVAFARAPGGVILLSIVAYLAQLEAYSLLRAGGQRPLSQVGSLLGVATILGLYFTAASLPGFSGLAWLAFSIVVLVSICILRSPLEEILSTLSPTLLGYILVPFSLSFYVFTLLLLQENDGGDQPLYCIIWMIAVAKFSDVGGLIIGSRFGRTPMSPILSPRKTVEGAFGGLLFSVLTSLVLYGLAPGFFPAAFTFGSAIFGGILLGAVAIPSDLFGSVLKRMAKVKDSGFRIPGIGGLLDLTDSLILTAPVGFIFFLVIT
ncbi:MAG: phosphatidate cytidylyltransferase [Puniceicoccaceae bacterium]